MSESRDRGAVVITGASTGIGRASALRLDAAGFRVFAGVRKEADGRSVAAEASERLKPLIIDVVDEASIESAAGEVETAVGDAGLGGLFNNAGIAVPGPLEFVPIEALRRQLEVNVIGQVAVTQRFLPLLRKAKGRILFTSSIGGRLAMPVFGPYAASKFAVEAIGDAFRRELRGWGISVSLIEPGSIATPIWEKGEGSAQSLRDGLGEDGQRLYRSIFDSAEKAAGETAARGIPPDRVAEVVERALTARRPKTRYLVGRDAKGMAKAAALLPDRAMDAIIARQIG